MRRRKQDWVSMEELFHVLSEKDIYVVLTGDELLERGFAGLGPHHDIDILSVNRKRTAGLIGAGGYGCYYDEHYRVCIRGRRMTFGIFELGDGYMDPGWQKEMLQNRVLHPSGHYIMDPQNHFYWMLYHVLCQKKQVPEHYRARILEEAAALGITSGTDGQWWRMLESFLLERNYSCPYPHICTEKVYTDGFQVIRPDGYGRWKRERIRKLPIRVVRRMYRRYLRKKYR